MICSAAITKPLQALGLTSGIGYAIEGIVEGGFYDNARRKGYNHQQAMAETFTPGLLAGRPEDVPWYGGAKKLREKEKELTEQKRELKGCDEHLLNLHKNHGYYEQKIENLTAEQEKYKKLQDDYEAYDMYMKCMHPNGIAYNVIKNSLPVINSEISKILANIVDFQVYFETDDNRLDIYIQQPNRDASPLEMASGAEKAVAAMAIRLAFTNISSLPKSQLFVLDEPGTALDAERMEGFVRILDITTSIFKTVILISHLDNLKDAADSIINIENKDGFANVCA